MYHSTSADLVLCHRGTPIASFAKQGIRSHLRLGPLVIVTGPQCPGSPIFDPCSIGVGYADRPTAEAIVSWAVAHVDARGAWPHVPLPASINLESLVAIYRESELRVAAGGIMVRTSKARGVAVGLVGRRMPALSWLRPRMIVARARWVMAGRPDTPSTPNDQDDGPDTYSAHEVLRRVGGIA